MKITLHIQQNNDIPKYVTCCSTDSGNEYSRNIVLQFYNQTLAFTDGRATMNIFDGTYDEGYCCDVYVACFACLSTPSDSTYGVSPTLNTTDPDNPILVLILHRSSGSVASSISFTVRVMLVGVRAE